MLKADFTTSFELSADERIMQDEAYMRICLHEAEIAREHGEVPIGAVVVHNGNVIAQAHNERESAYDPTGHAELIAIRKAAQTLENWRLSECDVYVTLEPCVMCAGAMHQARIRRCVFGARDEKAGALESLYAVASDERLNHQFDVTGGILQKECAGILQDFFRAKRA